MKNGCLTRLALRRELLRRVPLEVAVGRQQTAPLRECALERGLLGQRLDPGVDHPRRRSSGPWPTTGPVPRRPWPAVARRACPSAPRGAPGRRPRRPPWSGRRCSRARAAARRPRGRPRTPRRGRRACGSMRSDRTCRQRAHSPPTGREIEPSGRLPLRATLATSAAACERASGRARPAASADAAAGRPSIHSRVTTPVRSSHSWSRPSRLDTDSTDRRVATDQRRPRETRSAVRRSRRPCRPMRRISATSISRSIRSKVMVAASGQCSSTTSRACDGVRNDPAPVGLAIDLDDPRPHVSQRRQPGQRILARDGVKVSQRRSRPTRRPARARPRTAARRRCRR